MAHSVTLQTSRPVRIRVTGGSTLDLNTGQVLAPVRILRDSGATVEFRWHGERCQIAREDYNSLHRIGSG